MQRLLFFLLFVAGAFAIGNGTYDTGGFQHQTLTPGFDLFWLLNSTSNVITIAVEAQVTGWVAFGLNPSPSMVGSDVFIGWLQPGGAATGQDWFLSGYPSTTAATCPGTGVCTDSSMGFKNDVVLLYGDMVGGLTRLQWQRSYKGSDPTPVDWPFSASTLGYVYATGAVSNNVPQKHTATTGFGNLNFATGAISLTIYNLKVGHGALMFVAWGVLIPLGSSVARWLKRFGWWFNIHRMVQSIAILATVAGFVMAVEFSTTHFNTVHKSLGLAILAIGLVQPSLGILADKLFELDRGNIPMFPDMVHWFFGWSSLILGLVNIPFGLYAFYGIYNGLVYASIAFGAVVFVALVAIFVVIRYRGGSDHY